MKVDLVVNTENQNHQNFLSSLIEHSEESILCSGWLKAEGLKCIEEAVKKACEKNFSVSIISNLIHTQKRASHLVKKWAGVRHFITVANTEILHSKVYYFRTGDKYTAIVGSANITKGGLVFSDEASLKIVGIVGDDFHAQVRDYLDGLIGKLKLCSKPSSTANA